MQVLKSPAHRHREAHARHAGGWQLDLDLFVHGPNGALVASSANGTSTGAAVSVPSPVAGTWRVRLEGFFNTPTQYTGTAAVDRLVPLP